MASVDDLMMHFVCWCVCVCVRQPACQPVILSDRGLPNTLTKILTPVKCINSSRLGRYEALCFPLKPKSKRERSRWASWDCVWSFLDTVCQLSSYTPSDKRQRRNTCPIFAVSPSLSHTQTNAETWLRKQLCCWHCFPCRLRLFSSCQVRLPFDNFPFPHCFACSIFTFLSTLEPQLL